MNRTMEERTELIYLDCRVCKLFQPPLKVAPEDIKRWQQGELIQNALPYLSTAERELLISRFCSTCWEKYFGEEVEPAPAD